MKAQISSVRFVMCLHQEQMDGTNAEEFKITLESLSDVVTLAAHPFGSDGLGDLPEHLAAPIRKVWLKVFEELEDTFGEPHPDDPSAWKGIIWYSTYLELVGEVHGRIALNHRDGPQLVTIDAERAEDRMRKAVEAIAELAQGALR